MRVFLTYFLYTPSFSLPIRLWCWMEKLTPVSVNYSLWDLSFTAVINWELSADIKRWLILFFEYKKPWAPHYKQNLLSERAGWLALNLWLTYMKSALWLRIPHFSLTYLSANARVCLLHLSPDSDVLLWFLNYTNLGSNASFLISRLMPLLLAVLMMTRRNIFKNYYSKYYLVLRQCEQCYNHSPLRM